MWVTGDPVTYPRTRMSIGFTYDLVLKYPQGEDVLVPFIKERIARPRGKRRHLDNGHFGERMALKNYLKNFQCACYWFPKLVTRSEIPYLVTKPDGILMQNGHSPILVEVKTPLIGWVEDFQLGQIPFLQEVDGQFYLKNSTRIYHQMQLTMLLCGFNSSVLLVHCLHTNTTHEIQVYIDPKYLSYIIPFLEYLYKKYVFPTIVNCL